MTDHSTRRPVTHWPARALVLPLTAVAAAAALYVLLPRLAGLDETWRRLSRGDSWWLTAALGFELLSYAS